MFSLCVLLVAPHFFSPFFFWQIASGNCGNNLQLTKYEDQLLEHDLCACYSSEGNKKKRGNKFINLCKISRLQSFRHCNLIFMAVRLCIYEIHSSANSRILCQLHRFYGVLLSFMTLKLLH